MRKKELPPGRRGPTSRISTDDDSSRAVVPPFRPAFYLSSRPGAWVPGHYLNERILTMPLGRILLKSISNSKKLSLLKTDGARLLYTWLIPHLDVNGCFSAAPEVVGGHILTRLNKEISEIATFLDDLERVGLILRYQANGDIFLRVPDFIEKQPSLHPEREAKPSIPLPTARGRSGP